MTLDYITVKGFKSIASIEKLAIRPVNIVIGANGSGKSNFLGAFSFLRAVANGHLQRVVIEAGGAESVLYFGSKVTREMHLHLTFRDQSQYGLALVPVANDRLAASSQEFTFTVGPGRIRSIKQLANELEPGISPPNKLAGGIFGAFRQFCVYHLNDTSTSSPMRKTAKVNDNRALHPDGSNLAAFLYFLQQRHHSAYELIRKTIQLAAPFFDDFRLEPLRLKDDDIKLEWRHRRNPDQYFDVSSLSDGTLRFIALTTLFLQPAQFRPSVILVDEPELGLHPYAITLLSSLIKQASATSQVIVSTQSPQLLDHFEPEDVLVADRVDGGTVLARLDSKRLKRWLKRYTLGQLWDKNEIGGRPDAESR